MCNVEITNPPELDHDALMLSRYQTKVTPLGRVERRVLWNLFQHMAASGWVVTIVDDGEDITDVISSKQAMELVFDLDDAHLAFGNGDNRSHVVWVVLGNSGWDMISDWNYSHDDADGFNAAMTSYDAERVADSLR